MIPLGLRSAWRAAGVRRGWLGLLLVALGCASNSVSRGAYDFAPPESECLHSVELLSAAQLTRPYLELASLSATCPSLSPRACAQTLLARGCELHADAVVIDASSVLAPRTQFLPPRGRTNRALLAEEARAIRYRTVGQTH